MNDGAPVKTIWVTRAFPGARATAERVRALGFEALAAPLLEVRALEGDPIDLAGVGAIAFTSANGVRAFAARSAERGLTVFAVGRSTAAAAEAEGFGRVLAGDAGVEAVAGRIAAHRRELAGPVLHPGATEPAGDLAGALAALGVEARSLPLYETVAVRPGPEVLARIPGLHAALLHSPKAARALAEILREVAAPRLHALCLSEAVAQSLAGVAVGRIAVSPSPDEDSLINLIAG
ncbi:MAG: uroporphyrinogen-III synthase [Pseudomonadota bacterium]